MVLVTPTGAPSRAPAAGPGRIGPGEALELAVLGVASHGPVEIEAIPALVRGLGGPGWHPTADVVLACCERLLGRAALRMHQTADVAGPAVALTAWGRQRLKAVLRMEAAAGRDPLAVTVALLKVAFLPRLAPGEQWRALDRMVAAMEEELAERRAAAHEFPIRTDGVRLALGYELISLENRIGWMAALRDSVASRLGAARRGPPSCGP